MMLLEHFDPDHGTATFTGELPASPDAHQRCSRLTALAARIGLHSVQLRTDHGLVALELPHTRDHAPHGSPDGGVAPYLLTLPRTECLCPVVHVDADAVTYHFRIPRDMTHVTALGAALGLVFAAYGEQERDLVPLRIALYEILANTAEHGIPRASHPDTDHIEMRLTLGAGSIHGEIEDRCEAFDPTAGVPVHVAERVALRHKRGLGLPMISQLLDQVGHRTGAEGNHITFAKRIRS